MYIWIGCKLPEDFEREIRSLCLTRNEKIGLDTVAFTLPQHISLKISFETDRHDDVLKDLVAFLSQQTPIVVHIQNPEQAGNILWLPVAENHQLDRLHRELDARLESQFGVVQHAFDKAFLFHSTLFMDENTEKIAQMGKLLSDYPIERDLPVDAFLLGISETGKAGSYRVVRQIKVL